ncbi:hypothetical protein Bind_3738 (plasmid) [Beijerinckia indica subsp. indica ATCC 9039]|uniref:Uncharacterized protein n=1 Tax=Beijerinckia indica subsp. indica (strain ATCC 9039 / DSM 1715 / NCIMB 8712) TaxID=395963 RepID=B2IL89_BEII9|nr:hypothetical protein Bind_3738 [Beijerinckia indica subsp. indica ATCC 9039]
MNKDLAAAIEKSNASFEKTVREQTCWLSTVVFAAVGVFATLVGILIHFK